MLGAGRWLVAGFASGSFVSQILQPLLWAFQSTGAALQPLHVRRKPHRSRSLEVTLQLEKCPQQRGSKPSKKNLKNQNHESSQLHPKVPGRGSARYLWVRYFTALNNLFVGHRTLKASNKRSICCSIGVLFLRISFRYPTDAACGTHPGGFPAAAPSPERRRRFLRSPVAGGFPAGAEFVVCPSSAVGREGPEHPIEIKSA